MAKANKLYDGKVHFPPPPLWLSSYQRFHSAGSSKNVAYSSFPSALCTCSLHLYLRLQVQSADGKHLYLHSVPVVCICICICISALCTCSTSIDYKCRLQLQTEMPQTADINAMSFEESMNEIRLGKWIERMWVPDTSNESRNCPLRDILRRRTFPLASPGNGFSVMTSPEAMLHEDRND